MKVDKLVPKGNELIFSVKLFIIYNIKKNQVTILVVFFHKKLQSPHPHFTADFDG